MIESINIKLTKIAEYLKNIANKYENCMENVYDWNFFIE